MDPDANLAEIRRLVARMTDGPMFEHDAARLVVLVAALDEWLTRGGFLPQAWRQGGAR